MRTFLAFAGLGDLLVEAVDRRQHFAEKLHALTRDYGDRPNTRVKDLPDLLTLIEHGLEPDETLLAAVESLFETRRTHPVPDALPDPPVSWRTAYERFATQVALDASMLDVAHERLTEFWAATLRSAH